MNASLHVRELREGFHHLRSYQVMQILVRDDHMLNIVLYWLGCNENNTALEDHAACACFAASC